MNSYEYDISKLAERKARLGLTDKVIAQRAGVHPSTVKNVLTGQTCKAPTIKKLAEALGLDLSELVIEAPDKERVA